MRSKKNSRMNISILIGRRAKYDFLASCNFSRNSQHQYSWEKWCCSTRNIQSHFFDSYRFLPASHTVHCFYLLSDKTLGSMKGFNILFCQGDGCFQFIAYQCSGNLYLFRSHSKRRQGDFIKSSFILYHGCISFSTNTIDNAAHRIKKALRVECRTFQYVGPLLSWRIFYLFHIY